MAGRLNFSITLNLLIGGFKRSAGSVKNSFASMQAQALSYAAALGATTFSLAGFVSEVISVVRETSRANTALRNVSATTADFAKNLKFTTDLANKYGVYVNDVTSNFAKFSAAGTQAGVSMSDQKKIFDSLSRSIVAYGMSSEDANLTFLAVTQMMSKGKISSEELRRQLGERLPTAMAAMAQAAGVPIQKLDKLLSQGKLMSAEVLPKFADALNKMMPDVNTDNVEISVNRLKNAFQQFANQTGAKDAYKNLIDYVTSLVKTSTENIKYIVSAMAAFIQGVALAKLFKWIIAQLVIARRQAQAEAAAIAKAAGQSFDEAAWRAQSAGAIIGRTFTNIGKAIKTAFMSALPTLILVGIMEVISYFRKAAEEAERIRNIFSDYKKETASVTHTSEIIQLQTLQKLYNDATGNKKLQHEYQTKIETLLGTQIKNEKDINAIIAKRLQLLEATAKVDFYTQKKIEFQDRNATLGTSSGIGEQNLKYLSGLKDTNTQKYREALFHISMRGSKSFDDLDKAVQEYSQNMRVLSDADSILKDSMKYVAKNEKTPTSYVDDEKKKKKTPLQKQEEAYAKNLEELNARLQVGSITQAEYNKALGELNIKAYADAKGTNDAGVLKSKYFEARKQAADEAVKNRDSAAAMVEFEKVQKDYNEKLRENQANLSLGIITNKKFNENVSEAAKEAATSAASIKGIGHSADGFIGAMLITSKYLKQPIIAASRKRDTSFDYRKEKPDIAEENLNIAKDYVTELKTQLSGQIGDMMDELNTALENADFEKAFKLANAKIELKQLADAIKGMEGLDKVFKLESVKKYIKDINKDLRDTTYSGIKDIASSSDRVVSAFQNLNSVMNDVDSSGWERIMAIWNALTNTVDGFLSIIDTINKITELTTKLGEAKEAEAAIDTATTVTKVTNKGTETTAALTALGTETTAEVAASAAKTTAASVEMAAKSTAAYAYIPFAGVGLAAAQIKAMQALIATAAIPKFATGGTMPRTGDNMLARINPGEMILNDGQQSRLFHMLDSGIGGSKSNINIGFDRVRGSDIYLALKNYMKSTNKKL